MREAEKNSVPDLSVVIINWKMSHQLKECLPTIFNKEFSCSYEIIVVNKPSGDGTEELLRERYPEVRLIEHEIFGIAEMRNVGIKQARGRYVLMLDADTEVLDDAFGEMVRFMDENPEVGAGGGKTLKPDGSLEYSCKRFYTLWTIVVRRTPIDRWFPNNRWTVRHLMVKEDHDRVLDIDWMAGACFLMRRETIEEVGLFDDSFYFGFEDVDWCYRAKKQGWRICYIPSARIVHHVQRSSAKGLNRMAWEHLKSGMRFYVKHYLKRSK